ncbi:hypothetical protein [Streptomyces sp. NBC_01451]|uniref:hypothetical protein n=1 Tax=Streptomyces sp. NBC_01451 TaxID=2903872 RepID=UPI002E30E849|nr:hypothetical protein [Streptomyces sp. NBC_01451]
MTEEPKAGVDSLPIDVESISGITDDALKMELSTSTREDIDFKTTRVIGLVSLLLAEELGANDDDEVMDLLRQAYKLLDLTNRPGRQTPSFTAFFFMRDVANLTRRLTWVYVERNGGTPQRLRKSVLVSETRSSTGPDVERS